MSDGEVTGVPAAAPSDTSNNVASVESSILGKLEAALNGTPTNGTAVHEQANAVANQITKTGQPLPGDQPAATSQEAAAAEPQIPAAADTRPRDPVTGQFLSTEPEIEFGEYGKVKASEVPALHQSLVEFERNQAAIRSQQADAAARQHQAQAQHYAQQVQEYQLSEGRMVQWAQSDPQGLIDFLSTKAVQSGYQPQPQQYGQPQAAFNPYAQAQQPQAAVRPEEIQSLVATQVQQHIQQMQAQQQAEQARAQHYAQVSQQFDQLVESAIPKAQYGAFQDEMINAVKSRMRDAPAGTFVPGMPLPLVMRKVAGMISKVKDGFNSALVGRKAQQAAITGGVGPQPSGGTMIPKAEPQPYEPFDVNRFAAKFENRFKEHLTGL